MLAQPHDIVYRWGAGELSASPAYTFPILQGNCHGCDLRGSWLVRRADAGDPTAVSDTFECHSADGKETFEITGYAATPREWSCCYCVASSATREWLGRLVDRLGGRATLAVVE